MTLGPVFPRASFFLSPFAVWPRRARIWRSSERRGVVDGEAVNADHCAIRIVHFKKDNLDSPQSDGERDVEMEWELIARAEPERAERIRQELAAKGLQAP